MHFYCMILNIQELFTTRMMYWLIYFPNCTETECSTRNISEVLLPAGQQSNNYQLPLCIGLTDSLGTESFSYAYSVVVKPSELTSSQLSTLLSSTSSSFQKFVSSGDVSQVSSFVIALTSSLNSLSDFAQIIVNAPVGGGVTSNYSTASTTMSAATQSAALGVQSFPHWK